VPDLLRKRPSRLLTAFVGLCHLVLSLALPFQHHHEAEEAQALLRLMDSTASVRVAIPLRTRLTAKTELDHPDHCLACEWQAANVSPALPPVTLACVRPVEPRVTTTLPRYLGSRLFSTSSRAPPLA
jgi:hypothetical protein